MMTVDEVLALTHAELLALPWPTTRKVKGIGCRDCIDCTDCTGCIGCRDCRDCIGCTDCIGCRDCTGCRDCIDCIVCIDCYKTSSLRGARYVVAGVQLTAGQYATVLAKLASAT